MTVHLHCQSCGNLEVLSKDEGKRSLWKCQNCLGNPWKQSILELPLHDCIVECANDPKEFLDIEICEYNGYGFKSYGMYKEPIYWRYTQLLEKKYGKL